MGKPHMTNPQRDEAIELYTTGALTRDGLASLYGRGRRTIDQLIRRRGAKQGHVHRLTHRSNRDVGP